MPKGKEPSWPVQKLIFELLVRHGNQPLVIQRSLDIQIPQKSINEDTPGLEWIKKTVKRLQDLPLDVLTELPPSVWEKRHDYEAIKDELEKLTGRADISKKFSERASQVNGDNILIEATNRHLKGIALLLERWGDNLETARNIGDYAVTYDVEGRPLFPYVLQHCPSVNKKYQNLKLKRQEFETKMERLAKRLAEEASPEATEWFSKVAAYYSVELALERSSPSYDSAVHVDAWALYVGDKVIAKGSPEAMERCEKLHKELIRNHVDSQEVSSMANDANGLRDMQMELAKAIGNSRLRQEWINNECDFCPGKSISYQQ